MEQSNGWAARKVRHPLPIEATVLRAGGGKTAATLTGFSDAGCRVEGIDGLHVGERLQLALPRMGQIKAQVRWIGDRSAGVRFLAESDF